MLELAKSYEFPTLRFMKQPIMSFQLTPEMRDAIALLAAESGVSMSDVVRAAILRCPAPRVVNFEPVQALQPDEGGSNGSSPD